MKVFWLNDSLTFRGETREEKRALAVMCEGLNHDTETEPDTSEPECSPTSLSA